MRYLPFIIIASLIAGCGVRAPKTGRADPYAPHQIHFASSGLENDTAVGAPVVSRDHGGLLFVSVPIRSAINKTLYVDYRTTFFDAAGQEVGQTGWLSTTLEANTPQRVTVNSTTARASDFQIDFRYAR